MLYDDRKPALPKVVQVTREHIQSGYRTASACMVAKALWDAGYTDVKVGYEHAETWETGFFKLSPEVTRNIRKHDDHQSRLYRRLFIRPFEVQVP